MKEIKEGSTSRKKGRKDIKEEGNDVKVKEGRKDAKEGGGAPRNDGKASRTLKKKGH